MSRFLNVVNNLICRIRLELLLEKVSFEIQMICRLGENPPPIKWVELNICYRN
jgi:hypothetical protein